MMMHNTRHLLALALTVAVAACGDDGGKLTPDAPIVPDAATPAAVTLSTAGTLGARLVDKDGKSLYFFANDVPGSNASACTGGCPAMWPSFDVQAPTVGEGLTAADFGRFDRGNGTFQATWKGRPLYYFANDTAAAPTAGEGVGGRWFVARAYNLFFGANATVTPQGAAAANAPFLTNGAGRTLYVFQLDVPGVGATPPTSTCAQSVNCVAAWPLWEKPAALTNVVVPSTIQADQLTSFASQNKQQFAYKGWPLYFFATDDAAGEVAGDGQPNWHSLSGGWNGTFPVQ